MVFLPILSALVYYFAEPWYSLQYAAYISLIPLFISIEKSSNIKTVLLSCLLFSITISAILCIPLYYAGIINYGAGILFIAATTTLLVIIPNTILYSIYGILHYILRGRLYYLNLLIPPSLWILTDYIREISDFLIPWYFIGYSQVRTPFIQAADITGIYGISFFIVLVNYMLTMGIIDNNYRKLKFFILLFLLSAAVFTYGIYSENRDYTADPGNRSVNITGVQGNTGSHERWDRNLSFINYRNYLNLTEKYFQGKEIIIWPETVLNSSDRTNFEIIEAVNSFTGNNTIFITGGTRIDSRGNTFNSIFISNKGLLSYIYDKRKLFPYSEKKIAGLGHKGITGSPDFFTAGTKHPLFSSDIITPSLSICFESLYPSIIRKQVKEGADILINIANDSWFGDTYEPFMHFNSTVVRAIENRRSMARITNSGISALIAPSGKIKKSMGLNESGVITGELTVRNKLTFYTVYGDIILLAAALITAAAIIIYIKKPDSS